MARRRRHSAFGGRLRLELRLAYGSRAISLGAAILALLPPAPPAGAPCRWLCAPAGSGCLLCRRWAHLLRPGDPIAYRRLVTRAVCAVQHTPVPPLPPRYTPGNGGHPQAKLLRVATELTWEKSTGKPNNVLCNGIRQGGLAGSLLTSPSWDILLQRIGDMLMCYILMHSSIFLPVRKKDFLQVTGVPVNTVLQKRISSSRMSAYEESYSVKAKCHKCYMFRDAQLAQNFSVNTSKPGLGCTDNTQKIDAQPNSDCVTRKLRKRKRLYGWQRRSKHKQACLEDWSREHSNLLPDGSTDNNVQQIEEPCNVPVLSSQKPRSSACMPSQGLSCGYKIPGDQSTRPQSGPVCFNCLLLNASKCVSVDSLIRRHNIFYNIRISKNVLHRISILLLFVYPPKL